MGITLLFAWRICIESKVCVYMCGNVVRGESDVFIGEGVCAGCCAIHHITMLIGL